MQAVRDKKRFDKKVSRSSIDRISNKCYESATYYLDEELPVIREVLGECFKEK